jgi:predicted nucleic acid-binding protein
MNGDYLLDTNIVIALFANDLAVRDHLKKSSYDLTLATRDAHYDAIDGLKVAIW